MRQPDQDEPGRTRTRLRRGLQDGLEFGVVERRNHRRREHPHRDPRLPERGDGAQPPRGSRRAGFHGPREVAPESGHRDHHPREPVAGHLGDDVEVPQDQRRLRDDAGGVARLAEHLEDLPGDAEVTLDRLIGIGVRAERQRTDPVAGLPEFAAQQVGGLRLGHDLGLEVEAGREPQVLVARPRKTVDAAVLAAPIGVDGPVERDVRRVVPGDDRLRPVDDDFRRNALGRGIARIPPVVERLLAKSLEAPGGVGPGPPAPEGLPPASGIHRLLARQEGVEQPCEGGLDLPGVT